MSNGWYWNSAAPLWRLEVYCSMGIFREIYIRRHLFGQLVAKFRPFLSLNSVLLIYGQASSHKPWCVRPYNCSSNWSGPFLVWEAQVSSAWVEWAPKWHTIFSLSNIINHKILALLYVMLCKKMPVLSVTNFWLNFLEQSWRSSMPLRSEHTTDRFRTRVLI